MSIAGNTNSDYLTVTAPGTTQAFTCDLWAYFYSLPASPNFTTMWSIDDNALVFVQLYLQTTGAGTVIGFTITGGFDTQQSGTVTGQWYRICVRHTPGAPRDGLFVQTGNAPYVKTTIAVNGANNPDTTMYIFNERALDQNLDGEIVGFKLWERELSDDEIREQGKQLDPINTNGLRYYLPMNRKQAPQISEAGYGADGTLNGTLAFTSRMPPVPFVAPGKNRKFLNIIQPPATMIGLGWYGAFNS